MKTTFYFCDAYQNVKASSLIFKTIPKTKQCFHYTINLQMHFSITHYTIHYNIQRMTKELCHSHVVVDVNQLSLFFQLLMPH